MKRKGIIIIGVIVAVIIVIMATVGIGAFHVFRVLRGHVPVVVEVPGIVPGDGVVVYVPVVEVPGVAPDVDVVVEYLPRLDRVSGAEPLRRYPGSVMLSHGKTTFFGATSITITYGTMADVDTVVNWYKTTALAGWPLVEKHVEKGATTLQYVKKTEEFLPERSIHIDVWAADDYTAYTTITVTHVRHPQP